MAEALKKTKETPGQEKTWKAFDREIDEAIAGRPKYPNGTLFLPADTDWFSHSLREAALEHRPVVAVYPDGHETFLRPGSWGARGLIVRLRDRLRALRRR